MEKTGSVHGRFQPPHLEHLEYILAAMSKCEHLIIGITQPDISHLGTCPEDPHRALSTSNPLSYEERIEAIKRMLLALGIPKEKFSFSKFPIETPNCLESYIPIAVTCFTTIRDDWNRHKVKRLSEMGYHVEVLWTRDTVKGIQGTDIRSKISAKDSTWKQLVHPTVSSYLEEINVAQRLS